MNPIRHQKREGASVQQLISLGLTLLLVQSALAPDTMLRAQERSSPVPPEHLARPINRRPLSAPTRTSSKPAGKALPQIALTMGQTQTLLPDGRTLLLGGMSGAGVTGAATFKLRNEVHSAGSLLHPRAWHTATLLPDGAVLIHGGADAKGVVAEPEIFDPANGASHLVTDSPLTPRTFHTATLLTDGRVLLAGGVLADNTVTDSAELWDSRSNSVQALPALPSPRRSHQATLLANGQVVLWGGAGLNGARQDGALFDPASAAFTAIDSFPSVPDSQPELSASLPADGAGDIPLQATLTLRLSHLASVATANINTISLTRAGAPVEVKVVPAESGRLVFVTPAEPLAPAANYTLTAQGLYDANGFVFSDIRITFRTVPSGAPSPNATSPATPLANNPNALPPLQAPAGVTALSGRVWTVDTKPLGDVTLTANCKGDTKSARSDGTGRFLITGTASGHCQLEIDGSYATGKSYGIFFAGVDVTANKTNVLPYTIWMTPLDTAHAVKIPSPTQSEFVVSSPALPGLELHLPPQTVITDYDGKPVTELTITQIPIGRPPFPLPNANVPFYFTIQPGGSYIKSATAGATSPGARLFYPNQYHARAGTKYNFWNYDPTGKGWYVYGTGTVSTNGKQIVPDPGVTIYQLTGAMVGDPSAAPGSGPNGPDCCDPVDLGTGLFVHTKTDLLVPDVLPISVTRTYRPGDILSRSFGVGTSHLYEMFLVGDFSLYTYVDLVLPDGGRVHFNRTSAGTSFSDAVFQAQTGRPFMGATIVWNGNGWSMTTKDGTVFTFPISIQVSILAKMSLTRIQDRYGNTITLARDPNTGNLQKVTSPNGRSISFVYDSTNRITQVQDNAGRSVSYNYNDAGLIGAVTDVNGGSTQYTYDSNNQMTAIKDPRGITYITNQYDGNGRVILQTLANGGTYQIAYTTDSNGNITQTTITDPTGNVETLQLDTNGYGGGGNVVSDSKGGVGGSTQYDPNTHLPTSVTDALGRQTTVTYDGVGNVLSTTVNPGALTTTYTYESTYNMVTSVTDAAGKAMTIARDGQGNATQVTDASGVQTSFAYNAQGQVISASNAAGTTQLQYSGGSLTSVTDRTGATTTFGVDSIGRVISTSGPGGSSAQFQYDPANNVLSASDSVQGSSQFSYDGNGNLLSMKLGGAAQMTYAYDNMDKPMSRTDPLGRLETYTYDLSGRLKTLQDRKGQTQTYTYDSLGQVATVTYADSTVTLHYDNGGRLTSVNDSVSGAIGWTYDNLGLIATETGPRGTVTYTHDNSGNRTAMSVSGGPSVTYTNDGAGRATQMAQSGMSPVSIVYDGSGQATSMTLPNGITATYGYDGGSRLSSITYNNGSNLLGNLTYGYDAAGRVTSMGGSLASVNLPAAVSSASYDAANELTQWGGTSLSYDSNGNLTNDGTRSYTWDARNRLVSVSGPGGGGYQYDAVGRRSLNPSGTSFVYDGFMPLAEMSGVSAGAQYLPGPWLDSTFARMDGSGTQTYLTDALGSVVALTDGTGAIQTQYSYGPYGNTAANGVASTNPLQYAGREADPTGLYYYRARYYDPQIGRFISEDPIGFVGGSNFYAYALDNPMNYRDPSGEFVPLVTGAIGLGTGFLGDIGGQLLSGKSLGNLDWTEAGVAAGVGAAAGAAAPFVATGYLGAAVLGGLANLSQTLITNHLEGKCNSASQLFWSAATGLAGGAIGGPFSSASGYNASGDPLRTMLGLPGRLDQGAAQSLNRQLTREQLLGAGNLFRSGGAGLAANLPNWLF
jgi:RHS repeat-associated protein